VLRPKFVVNSSARCRPASPQNAALILLLEVVRWLIAAGGLSNVMLCSTVEHCSASVQCKVLVLSTPQAGLIIGQLLSKSVVVYRNGWQGWQMNSSLVEPVCYGGTRFRWCGGVPCAAAVRHCHHHHHHHVTH
jgi:hypothetical protein